jgi:hypothetical protein
MDDQTNKLKKYDIFFVLSRTNVHTNECTHERTDFARSAYDPHSRGDDIPNDTSHSQEFQKIYI